MLLELLGEIEEWCSYRNEIVHGLMNKNLESLSDDILQRVLDGKQYSEILDNQLKLLKKENTVLNVLKLQNN